MSNNQINNAYATAPSEYQRTLAIASAESFRKHGFIIKNPAENPEAKENPVLRENLKNLSKEFERVE